MIGDTVYEGQGIVTLNRVLGGGDGIEPPRIELTFKGQGLSKGIPVQEIWTFVATVNDDNSAMADGQGMLFTKDKDNREMVVATAKGLGKAHKKDDINKSQFIIFYTAKNPKARGTLNFLDKKIGMARLKTDEETMSYTVDVREWNLV